jgi:dihydropteroate synthase
MKDFKDLRDHAFCSLQRLFFEEFDAELTESKIVLDMPNFDREDIIAYLDEEGIEWEEKDGVIEILDPVEQADIDVEVEAEETDEIEESVEVETEIINEASARRKIVVRKGKKRIIFKCGPGMMKRGPRVCVRRPGSQLRKMQLRSKRSARKARSKKGAARRKRKLSMRKRLSFGLRPRKRK